MKMKFAKVVKFLACVFYYGGMLLLVIGMLVYFVSKFLPSITFNIGFLYLFLLAMIFGEVLRSLFRKLAGEELEWKLFRGLTTSD